MSDATPAPGPDESTVSFPVVERLDMGVDPVEDRLFLLVHTVEHGRRLVLLTRRMTRVVLGHIAKVMERTSEVASRAPSDQRQEVLRMEHMGALSTAAAHRRSGQETGAPTAGAAAPDPVPAYLATEVKVRVGGDGSLLLAILGPRRPAAEGAAEAEPVCALPLDRAGAHRLLGMLNGKAEAAQWDLSADPDGAWLRGDGPAACGPAH